MKQHDFDAVSFFSGVVLTLIGLLFLIPNTPSGIFDAIGNLGTWFWPALLLVIGAAVLIPALLPKKAEGSDQSNSSSTP